MSASSMDLAELAHVWSNRRPGGGMASNCAKGAIPTLYVTIAEEKFCGYTVIWPQRLYSDASMDSYG